MLCEAGEPLQNPALLKARLAGLIATLEGRTGAVERLHGGRDALRVERDAVRVERRRRSRMLNDSQNFR
jgi:hypothetical protein